MIKLLGAALILIASTVIGFEISRHLGKRPKQLRYFITALQALEAEIMFGHMPLQEASYRISKQLPFPLNKFFHLFSDKLKQTDASVKNMWETCFIELKDFLALKQNDIEILAQFGETLGKHDRYQQQKQILLTMSHIEREENEALQHQKKYEKMVKSLGFLTGLLLIILLL
ncbi:MULTISPECIES: stage III sporulation protein SpoIIIAB [Bacillus]|uniref:stage III sporulation protein SpoIIIAB n=1 Tax=Bacillus TaxID=1386 RepID=UPI0003104786|nr:MULTISPECIES: stage III sporulation protein SpoIIIAB [Bacillus]